MTQFLLRRKVLQSVVGGVGMYTLAPALRAASAAPATALAGNVSVLTLGGVNVVVATTDRGVVLVDTGPKENVTTLIEQLQAISTSNKYTLFITHWHSDQIGGQEVFLKVSSTIFAHNQTWKRHSSPVFLLGEEQYQNTSQAQEEPAAAYYKGSFAAGKEQIDYGYLPPGHTDGDMYVYFRDANVLAAGDIVSPERDPELDLYGGGWLGGRVRAMDILLDVCNDTTQIVPSYGPVILKPQLQFERDMMAFLYEKLDAQVRMGFTAQESFGSGVMNGFIRNFDDPRKFLNAAHQSLWLRYNKPVSDPSPKVA